MARPITWAIRVTMPDGRMVFMRQSGAFGCGPIRSFRTKADADAEAELLRKRIAGGTVSVIERSHGRQDLPRHAEG
jgi:hypothetical protein